MVPLIDDPGGPRMASLSVAPGRTSGNKTQANATIRCQARAIAIEPRCRLISAAACRTRPRARRLCAGGLNTIYRRLDENIRWIDPRGNLG